MLKRRQFIQSSLATGLALSGMPRLAPARSGTERRLAVLILRGGMDGLAAVPAYAENAYASLRGSLALAGPGRQNGVLDLDGFFGLHPKLSGLHKLYAEKELLVVHAVASSYRERSHFDGQKQLENGTNSPLGAEDGWLNRVLPYLQGSNGAAIALSQNVPLILHGESRVNSWSPAVLPAADEDTIERIANIYEGDSFFHEQFQSAIETRALAEDIQGNAMGGRRRQANLDVLARAAGRFLKDEDGARIAVLESSGWDTHANQGAANGQLANRFSQLDRALLLLKQELGAAWKQTVVLVTSEFGRTVAVNGSNGTDHGTGNVVFALGGAIAGGRVIADWPGLGRPQLYEGRDLKPTTDMRSLFKTVLHEHMEISSDKLEKTVFPDSGTARPLISLLA